MTKVDDVMNGILEHHGVKGQKWGVRRRRERVGDAVLSRGLGITTTGSRARSAAAAASKKPQPVSVIEKGKKLKTSGGKGHSAHPDAVKARALGQKARASGFKTLSNEELQAYSKRLSLEQSVKRLDYHEKNAAKRFIATLLGQSGKTAAQGLANEVATQQVKRHIGRRVLKGAAATAL